MKKILLVLKHEFISVVTRRSFILVLILIPLGGFLVFTIAHLISQSKAASGENIIAQIILPSSQNKPEGFVDQSGVIKSIPANLQGKLIAYQSEDQAKTALQTGTIDGYYILPADYISTGKITYIRPDFNPLGGATRSGTFTDLVSYWLVNGNQTLSYRLADPVNIKTVVLNAGPQRDQNNLLTFFIPYIVTMIFYVLIMGSSSLMLSNVSSEKTNRTIEILMTSVTPTEMLTGKIIALGLAGVLQTVVWTVAGYALLQLSGSSFNIPIVFQLPLSILIWGMIYFIGGYALYASLMAGVGALVPNLREAAQATFVVILPLIIPIMFIGPLTQNPDSTAAIFLSIFPLTAPITMMTRLAATHVPTWQVLVSIALLGISVVLVVRAVARMFRAQNLLTGQSFSLKFFLKTLFSRN